MITLFHTWLANRRAHRRQRYAQARLAELCRQTRSSPDHIVREARRAAALKGLALRRSKMDAQL